MRMDGFWTPPSIWTPTRSRSVWTQMHLLHGAERIGLAVGEACWWSRSWMPCQRRKASMRISFETLFPAKAWLRTGSHKAISRARVNMCQLLTEMTSKNTHKLTSNSELIPGKHTSSISSNIPPDNPSSRRLHFSRSAAMHPWPFLATAPEARDSAAFSLKMVCSLFCWMKHVSMHSGLFSLRTSTKQERPCLNDDKYAYHFFTAQRMELHDACLLWSPGSPTLAYLFCCKSMFAWAQLRGQFI